MLVLVQHRGIRRAVLSRLLRKRWPDIVLTDPGEIEPNAEMTVENAVSLACCRRGVEPLRVVVMQQRMADDGWVVPVVV